MKNLLIAGIALAVLAGSAVAKDLRPVYSAPPPNFSWTGFYVGGNIGYGVSGQPSGALGSMTGNSTFDSFPGNFAPYGLNAHREGGIGGGQIGYNYQLTMPVVVGLEADFQGAALSNSSVTTFTGMLQNAIGDDGAIGTIGGNQALSWFGTVRGRLGYTGLDPRMMPYLTGGLAYGKVNNSATTSFQHFGCLVGSSSAACAFGTANDNGVKVGWTLGGGAEWAPAALPNWSFKVEYLYVELPGSNLTPSGTNTGPLSPFFIINTAVSANQAVTNNFHIVRVGANYHLNGLAGAPSVAVARPVANSWAGFYVGGNVGYGISGMSSGATGSMTGDSTYDTAPGNFTPYGLNAHREGAIGGGQIGYNYQLMTIPALVGLEADFQGAALSNSSQTTLTGFLQNAINDDGAVGMIGGSQALSWFGTVRGRLGYTGLDPRLMPYLTGGLAYGKVNNSATASFQHYGCLTGDLFPNPSACAFGAAIDNGVKAGFALGGGAEWAPVALPNWSFKAEYLYVELAGSILTPFGTNAGPSDDRGFITTFVSANQEVGNNFHIVRVGASYKLGGWAPVVTR